jgi:hypothetical protein
VVSDNDGLPEAAATPVENIITDTPLDPNFIDDSDDSDDEPDLELSDVVPPPSPPDEASS